MKSTTKTRRPVQPSEVMALSFLAILLTHMMPRMAEDHPWAWWAWAVLLASVSVAASISVVLERRRRPGPM